MRRAALATITMAALTTLIALASAQPPSPPPGQGGPGGRPPGGPGGPGGPGRPGMMMPAATDSFAADRDSVAKLVMERIAGHEKAPAESVFKNIKIMKGVPAERMVWVMNNVFGRALGVRCAHCHVENHWADEDKPQKQTARDMMGMAHYINDSLMTKIKFAHEGEHHNVGCMTCHHGRPRP